MTPLWLKDFLKRKKDWGELTQAQVRAALRKQEIKHTRSMDKLRIEQFNLRSRFEKEMQDELKVIEARLSGELQDKAAQMSDNYKLKLEKYEAEIKRLTEGLRFAQDFWRILYKEKDELHNVAVVLMAKAETNLKLERDEVQALVGKKAEDLKQISICVEEIEKIDRRITKQNEFGERLMGLLPEEES